MKNPFKTQGFDSIIAKDCSITGTLDLTGTILIEGHFGGDSIKSNAHDIKAPSSLIVSGTVDVKEVIITNDLTVTGSVKACTVRVTGTLAVKSGCVLQASTIYYQHLVAEPGAVIIGEMRHLDHSSDPLEV